MKRITIKSISLRNFKGIKELDLDFNGESVTISGANATGKSTVMDSFLYLLFGKDSTDREEFGIIPLDKYNRPLDKVDNEVSAVLDEDGAEITLRRVHHQKWVKKQGTTDVVYSGNETLFFYNGVPQKASEYKTKIEAIMDEGIFKLVTSPLYFNSIHWQDRRMVLTNMAGDISGEEITAKMNGQAPAELLEIISKGKPVEEYRREIAARKKKLKEELTGIPTRIDELVRFRPEKVDEKAIQKQIDEKQAALDEIDQQIADVNRKTDAEAESYRSLRDSLNNLKDQAEDIRRLRQMELNQKANAQNEDLEKMERDVARLERDIESRGREVKFISAELTSDQGSLQTLRETWNKINAETLVFDEGEFSCPACKRPYEAEDIEAKKAEMTKAFHQDKNTRLGDITRKGTEIGSSVEQSQVKIKNLNEQISTLETQKNDLLKSIEGKPKAEALTAEEDLKGNLNYQGILKSIKELEEKLSEPRQVMDISSHQAMKHTITAVMDDLKKQLTVNESIEKTNTRIDELGEQEKAYAQQLADLENTEFAITQYVKARTDLIEEKINGKFSMVRFKMFKKNINGGEEEACDILINGVPFRDANNAAKINAGIDVINALSEHYGISAPIWIDNAESVVRLAETESQLIRLVVTKDKSLTLK